MGSSRSRAASSPLPLLVAVFISIDAAACQGEPKVRYLDGKWRMWYAATPVEAGKERSPDL
jgi:hypothetical protein